MKTSSEITLTSRLRLVPFILNHQDERILLGKPDGTEWIEFDPLGAAVLDCLDQGLTIEDAQSSVTREFSKPVDVLAFARDLDMFGFVAAVNPPDGKYTSSRLTQPEVVVHWLWLWRAFILSTLIALGYILWAFASRTVSALGANDLIIHSIPLVFSLLALAFAQIGLLLIHEAAHVLIGRCYGLTPQVKLSHRGLWLVLETDLTAVWALKRTLSWRPVAAGLMADTNMLALAVFLTQLVDSHSLLVAVTRMFALLLLTKMLWQFQWYFRTDIYFLISIITGNPNLGETAWHIWKRSVSKIGALPTSEIRAAKIYLGSLLLAACVTIVLWWWILIPFFIELIRAIGGSFRG